MPSKKNKLVPYKFTLARSQQQVAVNFDSGAIAASLQELQYKYVMGHAQAGLIGSMIYIGMVPWVPCMLRAQTCLIAVRWGKAFALS